MPRLDADEIRTGLGPDAERRKIVEPDMELRASRRTVADTSARQGVEDQRVIDEQIVLQCERIADDGGRNRVRFQEARRIDAAHWRAFFLRKDEAVLIARCAEGKGPLQSGMKAETGRHRRVTVIADHRAQRQRVSDDLEVDVELELKWIDGASGR